MALSSVVHALRTALTRLSEAASEAAIIGADQFDASELTELVRQAKASWPAADAASKAEVTGCAHHIALARVMARARADARFTAM